MDTDNHQTTSTSEIEESSKDNEKGKEISIQDQNVTQSKIGKEGKHEEGGEDSEEDDEKSPTGYKNLLRKHLILATCKGEFHCNYCKKDISTSLRIRCVECKDFDLCGDCFSVGASLFPHKSYHKYRVCDNTSYPLFTPEWSASEEERLLDGLQKFGFGNFKRIEEELATANGGDASSSSGSVFTSGGEGGGRDGSGTSYSTGYNNGNKKTERAIMEHYYDTYAIQYGRILPLATYTTNPHQSSSSATNNQNIAATKLVEATDIPDVFLNLNNNNNSDMPTKLYGSGIGVGGNLLMVKTESLEWGQDFKIENQPETILGRQAHDIIKGEENEAYVIDEKKHNESYHLHKKRAPLLPPFGTFYSREKFKAPSKSKQGSTHGKLSGGNLYTNNNLPVLTGTTSGGLHGGNIEFFKVIDEEKQKEQEQDIEDQAQDIDLNENGLLNQKKKKEGSTMYPYPIVPHEVAPLNPLKYSSRIPPFITIDSVPDVNFPGYMHLRDDYDKEHDDEAEMLLQDMEFDSDDDPAEKKLKLQVVAVYNRKLDEREKRKALVKQQNLVDYKRQQHLERRKPKDERELIARLRPFIRFQSPEENEQLVKGLLEARQLRKQIHTLQHYRRLGIRTHQEAVYYEQEKKKKEADLRSQQRKNPAEFSSFSGLDHFIYSESGNSKIANGNVYGFNQLTGQKHNSNSSLKSNASKGSNKAGSNNSNTSRKRKMEDEATDVIDNETETETSSKRSTLKSLTNKEALSNPSSTDIHKNNEKDMTILEHSNYHPNVPLDIKGLPGNSIISEKEKEFCSRIKMLPKHWCVLKDSLLRAAYSKGYLSLDHAMQLKKGNSDFKDNQINQAYHFLVECEWISPLMPSSMYYANGSLQYENNKAKEGNPENGASSSLPPFLGSYGSGIDKMEKGEDLEIIPEEGITINPMIN